MSTNDLVSKRRSRGDPELERGQVNNLESLHQLTSSVASGLGGSIGALNQSCPDLNGNAKETDQSTHQTEIMNIDEMQVKPLRKENSASTKSLHLDGCIVLGKKDSYTTRYRILLEQQHANVNEKVVKDCCCPCLDEPGQPKRSLGRRIWSFISNETFIFCLHTIVITLGVTKEALDLRVVAEDLHTIHSTIETFVCCLMLVILAVGAKDKYNALEGIDIHTQSSDRGLGYFKRLTYIYIGFNTALIIGDIIAFILFYFFAHLGWTLLSNNTALLLTGVCSRVVIERLSSTVTKMSQDRNTAVIYESLLIISEVATSRDGKARQNALKRVDRFCNALKETDVFKRPSYIECPADGKVDPALVATMEMQSMV